MTKTAKLSDPETRIALGQLTGWTLNAFGEITKTYAFAGFPQSLIFCNAVGFLAEAANHHPDILIRWNKVTLSLVTHDADGLTQKDFELAGRVDSLPGLK